MKFPFLLFIFMIFNELNAQSPIKIELRSDWFFKEKNKSELWNKATVPGCVQTDLMNNNLLTDPFYRLNEKDAQWIDKKDWVYKTSFTLTKDITSKDHILFHFKGLDTYAKVILNDIEIINANNMFCEWTVDCKNFIKKDGINTLITEFKSPINATIPLFDSLSFHYPAPNDQSTVGGIGDKKVSIFTRKAGYQYGWDWGPRLVTIGIWRPIEIEAFSRIHQTDFTVNTKSISDNSAELLAKIEIQTSEIIGTKVSFLIDNKEIASSDEIFDKGITSKTFSLKIIKPKLWWCNGLGEPHLYKMSCIISKDSIILDKKELQIGIRTIELVHEKDSAGKSFYFKLNGIPVFMKGANYIPLDNFPSRVTKERYEACIQSAVDANMNMLRVWGGGIYEDDIFYKLCDEKGILIWQDFMFACSLYPGDNAFIDNVKHEIIDNVKRLRNHPSIALWCGNNEINTAWNDWGWKPEIEKKSPETAKQLWNDYDKLFNQVIPKTLHSLDSSRFYWPSSPLASFDQKAGSLNSGDMHYWDVWHFGKPFKEYEHNVGRFMSEYGFQSFPDMKTIDKYTIAKDWDIESEVMTAHQRHPRGNTLIKTYLGYYYKTPKDFDNFLYVGQVLQAEGIKIAIEAHRRAKPHCMGTLYWQLNDCWPVASWSSTDYYGQWKALHYFVKKAYAPILLSQSLKENNINVTIVSDLLTKKQDIIECKIINFDGTILWQKSQNVTIKANTCTNIHFEIGQDILTDSIKNSVLVIVKSQSDSSIAPSLLYLKDVKDLKLPKPIISKSIEGKNGVYTLTLKSDKLAKNVYLQSDINGFFSDNFFDLLPNETRIIEFKTAAFSFENKNLKIRSLVDSY